MEHIAIFGGSGGLGSSVSKGLSQYGFDVYSLSSTDVDITNQCAVIDFFAKNSISIVINLSGLNYDGFIHKYNSSDLDKMIDVNIKGTTNILSACLPIMRKQNYGRIILTSSILAKNPVMGTGVYAACKSYIDSITRTVALENASKGITCNSLQLGYFDGGMTYRIEEEKRKELTSNIPLGRLGANHELLNTIKYIINTEYITGQNLNISGGL